MTDLKEYLSLGEHLRMLRESSGLTLKEVAANIEIDISLLAKIERNERQATRKIIKNLSNYFKVEETVLINEFLSDQIAYKVLNEGADLDILKVAEKKIKYGIIKHK